MQKIIFSTQWPFDFFNLKEDAFIPEAEAREKFDKQEYFVTIYMEDDKKNYCVSCEKNYVKVTLFDSKELPFFECSYKNVDSYKNLMLISVRNKNINYNFKSNGKVYITKYSSFIGKDEYRKAKYNLSLIKIAHINFLQYEEILNIPEINKLLASVL